MADLKRLSGSVQNGTPAGQHFPVKKGNVLFRGLGEIYRLFFAKIAATALTTANSIELRANFITR
jgi:hypothetical protein